MEQFNWTEEAKMFDESFEIQAMEKEIDYRDKRKEKKIEKEKKKLRKRFFLKKEDTKVRRALNRKFRRATLKNYDEDLSIRAKDYKTGGWVSH